MTTSVSASSVTFSPVRVPPPAGKGVVTPLKRKGSEPQTPKKKTALLAAEILLSYSEVTSPNKLKLESPRKDASAPTTPPRLPPVSPTKRSYTDETTSPFQSPEAAFRKNPQARYSKRLRHLSRSVNEAINNSDANIIPIKTGSNDVFVVTQDDAKVAYFKSSKSEISEAKSITEILMWRIAQIFGWEKQFTPTVQTILKFPDKSEVKGTLQPAIPGTLLKTLITEEKSDSIPFDTILESTVIATIMSMWDFHPENGIFAKLIHFFDNIRSLAHSNLFISRPDGKINSPLRICLNYLPQSWAALSEEHKAKIKSMVTQAKAQLSVLTKFFNSPLIQATIKELPPAWFNSKLILDSLAKRIDNIEKAFNNNRIHTLADISLCSSKGYRIGLGMTLASRLLDAETDLSDDSLKNLLGHICRIGYQPLDNDVTIFNKYGLSLYDIVTLSRSERPFLEIVKDIRALVRKNKENPLSPLALAEMTNQNIEHLDDMRRLAVPDWKDFTIVRRPVKVEVSIPAKVIESSSEEIHVATQPDDSSSQPSAQIQSSSPLPDVSL